MAAREILDRFIRCSHGEILLKLESATTVPSKNPLSALKYILKKKPELRTPYFEKKKTTRAIVEAVDLKVDKPNLDSMVEWLLAIGVCLIVEAFELFDKMKPDSPEGMRIRALIASAVASDGVYLPLDAYIDELKKSKPIDLPVIPPMTPETYLHRDLHKIGLSPSDLAALIEVLDAVNGQDAYDLEFAAIRRAKPSEYLVITADIAARAKTVASSNVGKLTFPLSHIEKITILALNARSLGGSEANWRVAMIRVYLIEYGYLRLNDAGRQFHVTHDEIRISTIKPTIDNLKEATAWILSPERKPFQAHAKALGLLAPIMSSDVFLRTGHHYITGTVYDDTYNRLFDAATLSTLKGIMPYDDLFHVAIHWIGPYTMRLAWQNLLGDKHLPNTFNSRFYAAPAGTALVTTTKAVLDAMSTLGCYESIVDLYSESIEAVKALDPIIKRNSTKYFELGHLFGMESLTATERSTLESTKLHAIRLAPVCKAFISTVAKDTAMSRAKALDKHAEQNQGVRLIAEKWFKAYMTKATGGVSLRAALGVK